jgi:hypothetical protein
MMVVGGFPEQHLASTLHQYVFLVSRSTPSDF